LELPTAVIAFLLSPPCFETCFPPTVPLVNSLTICYILKVNNAFLIEENCQHHFYLALEVGMPFSDLGDPGLFQYDDWAFVSGSYL
jgi:hypothetical protein